jgi:hypothetical protein
MNKLHYNSLIRCEKIVKDQIEKYKKTIPQLSEEDKSYIKIHGPSNEGYKEFKKKRDLYDILN